MKYHYLHETIRYSAIGEIDDIASYDIEWKFDDGEVLTGAVVEKIWYRLGDHSIQLTATDRDTGYLFKETLNVSILLRAGVNSDVKRTILNKIDVLVYDPFKKAFFYTESVSITKNTLNKIGIKML